MWKRNNKYQDKKSNAVFRNIRVPIRDWKNWKAFSSRGILNSQGNHTKYWKFERNVIYYFVVIFK